MNDKIARLLFTIRWLWPLGLFLLISIVYSIFDPLGLRDNIDIAFKFWLSGLASVLGLTYFLQKMYFEADRLFLQSFESYNKRYYELSDELEELKKSSSESSSLISPVAHKYFDLCIEEYQLYQRGIIPKDVWLYWAKGMEHQISTTDQLEKYWNTMKDEDLCFGLTREYIEAINNKKVKPSPADNNKKVKPSPADN